MVMRCTSCLDDGVVHHRDGETICHCQEAWARPPRIPPDGDWPRPAGCTCKMLSEAQACEERCDDSLAETMGLRPSWLERFWRRVFQFWNRS